MKLSRGLSLLVLLRSVNACMHACMHAPASGGPPGRSWAMHALCEVMFLVMFQLVVFYPDRPFIRTILFTFACMVSGGRRGVGHVTRPAVFFCGIADCHGSIDMRHSPPLPWFGDQLWLCGLIPLSALVGVREQYETRKNAI
jgi:hypothetical protein